jgi:signal transduction histidine kinase/ActR/RegA family two-component response regulator
LVTLSARTVWARWQSADIHAPEIRWESVSPAVAVLMTATVYFGAAKLGLAMATVAEQVSAVWPPTGIALALALLAPRCWPGITLGAFLAHATAREPVWTAGAIAMGNTAEALVGAWLLRRAAFNASLGRLTDVLRLIILAAFGSTIVSATTGVLSLCGGGVQSWATFGRLWPVWWIGDAMGDLVMAPLVLVWLSSSPLRLQPRRVAEAGMLLVALVTASLIVFTWHGGTGTEGYPLLYAIFPFVIWSALRFGQPGTTAVTFVASSLAIWGTVNGLGPFATRSANESLLLLQVFMALVAITALLLGAAIAERDAAERSRVHELHQRAAHLADADRHKDEFLATLAHELRNPLAPIRNAAELLRLCCAQPVAVEQARQLIERQIRHLVTLVDDLLDVSRIKQAKITLRKEPVALQRVVEQAVDSCRTALVARQHRLRTALPPEPLHVEGDAVRLEQVLVNLLTNAIKYTEPGGRVDVTVQRMGDTAVLCVADTGVGIAPDLLPQVFDLFTQGVHPLDRMQGGLGIGLTLVRRLVELHGGSVQARSGGLGQGSEFIVRLPLLAAPPAEARPPLPSLQRPGAAVRVVIVDDNQDAATSLKMVLEVVGYEVAVAHSGPAGLDLARQQRPDVVLLDIGLPGIDGYEVVRRLRREPELAQTVVVAVSGYGSEGDKQRAREAGFDRHLVKPVDPEELLALLIEVRSLRRAPRPAGRERPHDSGSTPPA